MKKIKTYKYSIKPEVVAQYEAMGRIGSYALNELNQFMFTAKKEKSTPEYNVFSHAKSGVRMYVQRKFNVIDKVEALELPFSQKVKISPHAIQRTVDRLGKSEEHAEMYIRQLLTSSTFFGEALTRRGNLAELYLHKKTGTTIVVAKEDKVVVTVYKAEEQKHSVAKITVNRIAEAIKRELRLLQTQLGREVRRLTEQRAELSVRAAEMALNKARCKAPHTQQLIQSRIEEVTVHINHLALEIDAKLAEIKRAEDEVKAIIAE